MEIMNYKGHEIMIERDDYPPNPLKDWDGHIRFCLFHRRYDLHNDTDFNIDDLSTRQSYMAHQGITSVGHLRRA